MARREREPCITDRFPMALFIWRGGSSTSHNEADNLLADNLLAEQSTGGALLATEAPAQPMRAPFPVARSTWRGGSSTSLNEADNLLADNLLAEQSTGCRLSTSDAADHN